MAEKDGLDFGKGVYAGTYKVGDRVLAVATIGRDLQHLKVEAEMEAGR